MHAYACIYMPGLAVHDQLVHSVLPVQRAMLSQIVRKMIYTPSKVRNINNFILGSLR